MTQQGLTWRELLLEIARRVREPDLFTALVRTEEQQTPYFDPDETERLLYRVSLAKLRLLPEEDLEACGPAATQILTLLNGASIPQNIYGIAGASMTVTNSGGTYVVAEFVPPPEYARERTVPDTAAAIYTVLNGVLQSKGSSTRIVFRTEPLLSDFQSDAVILTAEHNEDQIDQVHKLMLGQDFMPMGRL